MQFKKQFLLDNIEKFKIKHSKTAKNSPDRNVNNKKSDKSEQLARIEELRQKFLSNNAGKSIHGR